MGVIRWEDPPPIRQAKHPAAHDWGSIITDLRSRRGQWALAAVCRNGNTANTVAMHVRNGEYASFSGRGRFEAVARNVNGEARIYARYVGEAGSEATPNDLGEPGTPIGGGEVRDA